MKVVIAGAGIGGLTAGLCCLQRGFDVEIYEKAAELSEVGAGIQISPNAMRVMKALELDQAVIRKGFLPEKLETRMGKSGRQLFAINAQSWGAPYVHIHRADLIEILAGAFQNRGGQVKTGKTVTGFEQKQDHILLTLDSGSPVKGDYLIGADGIHSRIRRSLFGPDSPRFTGNIAWRAIVPTAQLGDLAPDPNATVWMGDKRHAVTYRLRGGALTNFVGVVETTAEMEEGWTHQGRLEDLRRDFQNWHPIIENLIENIDGDHLFKWALYDREPLQSWNNANRVTLLGDAAHPVLPFMAQGAAMAIEDSWVLAHSIEQNDLSMFEATRLPRTTQILEQSRQNMRTFHRAASAGRLSYFPLWLGGRLGQDVIKQRFDWIYGYDITKT